MREVEKNIHLIKSPAGRALFQDRWLNNLKGKGKVEIHMYTASYIKLIASRNNVVRVLLQSDEN